MNLRPVLGYEVGDLIREVVPPWLIPVFIFITYLGNPVFFLVLFVLDYWFRNSERGAHAISLMLGGIALVTALKTFFDAPRPPQRINVVSVTGFAFPSGHATGSTIGYGLLAFDLEIGSRRSRFAVAVLLIVLIALSRIVLGVHFVRDVVAGILIGSVFLTVAIVLTRHAPRPGFVLAVGLGVAAVVISGASYDGVAVLGGALGALVTWEHLEPIPAVDSMRSRLVLLGALGPVLAVLAYVQTLVTLPLLAVFVLNTVLMASVIASPFLVTQLGETSG